MGVGIWTWEEEGGFAWRPVDIWKEEGAGGGEGEGRRAKGISVQRSILL